MTPHTVRFAGIPVAPDGRGPGAVAATPAAATAARPGPAVPPRKVASIRATGRTGFH
ncbi:hypothetical protein GCM10010129_02590 [Streptomyces fumigatiscleroticus]|nr:hypothetical protein GCM10010129_02590 [Streptomyces fumigatiscleroticus]